LEEEAAKAENYLKRYMFYFARFESHEKSANTANTSLANAKTVVKVFIENRKNLKYTDLQFIIDSIMEIIVSHHILQWSYCYGYYLQDNTNLKELFQLQQGLLESFADQLHDKAEKTVDDVTQHEKVLDINFRQELLNLSKTVAKYRKNLIAALNDNEFVFSKRFKLSGLHHKIQIK